MQANFLSRWWSLQFENKRYMKAKHPVVLQIQVAVDSIKCFACVFGGRRIAKTIMMKHIWGLYFYIFLFEILIVVISIMLVNEFPTKSYKTQLWDLKKIYYALFKKCYIYLLILSLAISSWNFT